MTISDDRTGSFAGDVEQLLADLLNGDADYADLQAEGDAPDYIATFADHGVMTTNKGLVVKFGNGGEVQITIAVAAYPRENAPDPEDAYDPSK